MSAPALILELRNKGYALRADGGYLDVSPADITPELLHCLQTNKAAILAELQREDTAIRAWLARTGETDPATITEVMTACRTNQNARAYYLQRAAAEPTATEARQKVIAMLKAKPDLRYALATDDATADPVCLVLGIRSVAGELIICELRIPRDRYNPFQLIDLLEKYGSIPQ